MSKVRGRGVNLQPTMYIQQWISRYGTHEKLSRNLGLSSYNPVGNYMFKVNNRNTRARCEICSKLTIKTPERRYWCSGVFIVNFEHILHVVLVFLLLTLSR